MNDEGPNRRWPAWIGLALLATLALRGMSLGWLAITDNSESRYASIAWQMFSTGDWVTPRIFIRGTLVPFWGKPPLELWLTSLSFKVFGVSEWSARLPSFLLGLAILGATMGFAYQRWGRRVALLAGLMLATAAMFFLLAGACVLDVPLVAAVTGAMLAFARFAESDRRRAWGAAFFFALGVGMLAKGPVALVLVGLALGLWIAIVGRWRLLLQLPWVIGPLVFFAVAAPWYLLAERATPGFLRYFIVHEHLLRYVSHDYGDLYGSGRAQPFGASWVFLFAAFLPWSVLAIAAFWQRFRGQPVWSTLRADPWFTYVLVWSLTPTLFFTLARQILITYVVPGFAGLALATAVALDRWMESEGRPTLVRWLWGHLAVVSLGAIAGAFVAVARGATVAQAAILPLSTVCIVGLAWPSHRRGLPTALVGVLGLATVALLCVTLFLIAPEVAEEYSAKQILTEVYRQPGAKERPLVTPLGWVCSPLFYGQAMFGGRFVYAGTVGSQVIRERLDRGGHELFLFTRNEFGRLRPTVAARLQPVAETKHWVACEEKPPAPP